MVGLGEWRHICVDMQRMFTEDTPWKVEWMSRISEEVTEVAIRHPANNIFTRFIPPRKAEDMPGRWRDYYRKWETMTLRCLQPDLVGLYRSLHTSFRQVCCSTNQPTRPGSTEDCTICCGKLKSPPS